MGPSGHGSALQRRGPPCSSARAPQAGQPRSHSHPAAPARRGHLAHAALLRTSCERNRVYFSARPALNSLVRVRVRVRVRIRVRDRVRVRVTVTVKVRVRHFAIVRHRPRLGLFRTGMKQNKSKKQ